MSETRSITVAVAVIRGGITVPVRRVESNSDKWLVGDPAMSSRFYTTVEGFDPALDLAEHMAIGLERVRLLREMAQEAEDRLFAQTIPPLRMDVDG